MTDTELIEKYEAPSDNCRDCSQTDNLFELSTHDLLKGEIVYHLCGDCFVRRLRNADDGVTLRFRNEIFDLKPIPGWLDYYAGDDG